jgi:hypothetical protein
MDAPAQRADAEGPLMATYIALDPCERVALRNAPRRDEAPSWGDPVIGGAEGLTTYGAQNPIRSAQTRFQYADKVVKLDPDAGQARAALKRADRARTPAPEREFLNWRRPGFDPPPGTSGAANHVNPKVTAQAWRLARLGNHSLAASLLLSASEIMNAEDKVRAAGRVAGAEAGGWAGGVAGAEAGGLIGSVFPGPGTAIGALAGGLLGSIGGGVGGHYLGGGAVEAVRAARR